MRRAESRSETILSKILELSDSGGGPFFPDVDVACVDEVVVGMLRFEAAFPGPIFNREMFLAAD